MHVLEPLPSPVEQAERLIVLGVHEMAGLTAPELRDLAGEAPDLRALLIINDNRLSAFALTPLLSRAGRRGFVVIDMPDLDLFAPIDQLSVPADPVYFVVDVSRGDTMSNWSPNEALPAILAADRSPLTISEGIQWLIHQPEALERGRCFMTIGSRLRKATGALDSRTPAIWISNGTGRDGPGHRDAPKVGWCWSGNRHSWLGFASLGRRIPAVPSERSQV